MTRRPPDPRLHPTAASSPPPESGGTEIAHPGAPGPTDAGQGTTTERVCFRLQVKQQHLAEYTRHHAAVWPDMLRALKDTGWHNYSLFLGEDGLLIGYLETEDLAAAQAGMAATEVNARWQAEMAPFFEDLDLPPDQGFLRLAEVFHLEDQLIALSADEAGTDHPHTGENS
ncbi:L-rhamnose mutarotase [Kocuria sp. CPCC 205300]|uniref:L-rhamnose mutarotase n=1 Tax=Kocuria sabuli TaxID=3071448 RepID=UPI0036DC15EA